MNLMFKVIYRHIAPIASNRPRTHWRQNRPYRRQIWTL